MKLIKSSLYYIKYYSTWEDYCYVKANNIEEAIAICREYIKNKFKNDASRCKIMEVKLFSNNSLIESSTKTVTIDV